MHFNQPRAQAYLAQCGLKALIATSPLNVHYFSDYHCWIDPLMRQFMAQPGASSAQALASFAVYAPGGAMGAVLHAGFAVNSAECGVDDIHTYGDLGWDLSLIDPAGAGAFRRYFDAIASRAAAASPVEALVNLLRERGIEHGRVGIELENFDPALLAALRAELPNLELLDASNLIRLIRMVKTDGEIERLTRAAQINEQAAQAALALARPGARFHELRQAFRESAAAAGADFDHFCLSIRGLGLATEPNYQLLPDDVLYLDFGCLYEHYFSDSGMTLALGAIPDAVQSRYDALYAAIQAGRAALKPGALASAVREAMKQSLADCGQTASFPHGHGLGLELRDYPILVEDNGLSIKDDCLTVLSDLPLEPNMILNLEAGMFMPGVASLQIEDTFRLVDSGCEPVVQRNLDAPLMRI